MELPNYKEDLIVALQSGVSDDQAEQIAEMLYAPRTAAGHCRDCRWWSAEPNTPDLTERECMLLSESRTAEMPKPLASPSGSAGSTYECLWTEPDFGCVQFEAKP